MGKFGKNIYNTLKLMNEMGLLNDIYNLLIEDLFYFSRLKRFQMKRIIKFDKIKEPLKLKFVYPDDIRSTQLMEIFVWS